MSRTIRSIAGVQPVAMLDYSSTALVLIDFQNEYYDGLLPIPGGRAALRHAVELVALADARRMPVFHIQHIGAAHGVLFADGGALADIHPALTPAPRATSTAGTVASSATAHCTTPR